MPPKTVTIQNVSKLINLYEDLLNKFTTKLNDLKKGSTIILFVGNGISSKDLNTHKIIVDFFEDIRENHPREFQNYERIYNNFLNLLKNIDLKDMKGYNLLKFMTDFNKLGELKNMFTGFVIKKCCEGNLNLNHYYILLLIYLLSYLKNKKFKVVTFTVNYDNLIEKMYFNLKGVVEDRKDEYYQYGRLPLKRPKNYRDKDQNFIFLKEKSILNQDKKLERPRYVLNQKVIEKYKIPVVPLNGSVRICKCINCHRVLETEATATGTCICTRCGFNIPQIILPTKESSSDKIILNILENTVIKSNLMLFVGYNFDDPHINYRIEQGTIKYAKKSKVADQKLMINLLDRSVPKNFKKSLGQDVDIFELNGDLKKGILTLILSFLDNLTIEKFDVLSDIFMEDLLNE